MPSRSTSTVAKPCSAVEEAGCRQAGARGCSGSTNPSSRARSTPISHSASSSSWCALAMHALARDVRPMRPRASVTTSSARRWLRVAPSSSRSATTSASVGQLLGHAAPAGDQELAPVGDVGDAVGARRRSPPRRRTQREQRARLPPIAASTQTHVLVPAARACGGRGGEGGAAASAAAARAPARRTAGSRGGIVVDRRSLTTS